MAAIKKPTPVIDEGKQRICPICKKRSYSANGIHPQCAVQQADASGSRQFKSDKKPGEKSTTAQNASMRWKKRCPKCAIELHIRSKTCGCGHQFLR